MQPVALTAARFRWLAASWLAVLFALGVLSSARTPCETHESIEQTPAAKRQNYHTPPEWTPSLMKEQHKFPLISPLVGEDGQRVSSPQDWYRKRRPQLINQWTRHLGKAQPFSGRSAVVRRCQPGGDPQHSAAGRVHAN